MSYASFISDRRFLTRYHERRALALLAANAVLAVALPQSAAETALFAPAVLLLSSVSFPVVVGGFVCALTAAFAAGALRPSSALWIPFVAVWTVYLMGWMHNASHNNFKPLWLNRVIGEFVGMAQLVGFADWTVVHVLHHVHVDDKERDPHPAGDLPYFKFLLGMRDQVLRCVKREYASRFGDGEGSAAELRRLGRASFANQAMKVTFWFLLLGPEMFTVFFALSVVLKMMHYAWFNFVTHRYDGDTVETMNLDHSVYRFANVITSGLYFHKNHHSNPKHFDPRRSSPEPETGDGLREAA